MCIFSRSMVVVACLALGASAQDAANNDEFARMKRELQETLVSFNLIKRLEQRMAPWRQSAEWSTE